MSEELKPCPFCGTSDLLGFEPSPEGGWTVVKCRKCGASGSTGRASSEQEATAWWNRRAQPAEAEGVDFGFDDRSVKVSQEAYSIFLEREQHHLAALSAVTAERDRLRDAAGKAIAWLDAEQNGSGVGINRRIKLCRDAENALRTAMAAKEA